MDPSSPEKEPSNLAVSSQLSLACAQVEQRLNQKAQLADASYQNSMPFKLVQKPSYPLHPDEWLLGA